MTAQLRHIAIVTDRYTLLARFYEALFGMWSLPTRTEVAAMSVSDGHVGLNFNLRPPGRQAGLDHFGFMVDNEEEVIERASHFAGSAHVRRPSTRPFAGLSMNDPAGNVFDIAHKKPEKLDSVYNEGTNQGQTRRRISHFLLRAVDPERLAEFYHSVFDLIELKKDDNEGSFYLSDGTVTLIIAPWNITDYAGTGIARPSMDHLGFAVHDLTQFEKDLEDLSTSNAALKPPSLSSSKENTHRAALLARCSMGTLQICDPDGILIDVSEEK